MNRFFRTATSLLMLSAVLACSDDSDSLNFGNETALKRVSITGADFLTENGARSSVNIDENGVHFLWNANDTVGIFPNKGGQVEFAMEKGVGMQTATFNGGGWALKQSSTYSAYYPYNFYNRDLTKIPVNYTNQTQTGNNSTSHLGAYDFMAASVATPANGAVAFDMQHMGALVMLQANFNKTKTLDRVLLKTHSDIFTTRGTIDLTTANPKITSQTKSDIFIVSLNDFTVAPDETCIIYFMMPPTNLSGQTLEVLFYDEDGSYIPYEVAGKNFVGGTAYSYTLTNEVPSFVTVEYSPFTDAYTVNRDGVVFKNTLNWWQVEEQILAYTNMSKQVFEATYEIDGTSNVFNTYATDGLTPTTPLLPVGVVELTAVETNGYSTEGIQWTLTNSEAYEIFKQASSVTVYVRFQLRSGMNAKNKYIYVALTWTPSEINLGPIVKISDASKINEYWYTKNSNLAGSGYSDVHINVEVPGAMNADCEFNVDLKNRFVGNKFPELTGLAEEYPHLAATGKLSIVFVEEAGLYENVPGASGAHYNLKVSTDGSKLLTTSNALIAEITPDGVITLAQTPEAKDLLNNKAHNKLGDKETLTVKVGFKYTTSDPIFDSVELENNTFYVKILRPISVTEGTAEFEDAQTNGSRSPVHFDFIDWRDHKFVDNDLYGSNYYSYYGLNSGAYVSIEPDMDNITTNMNNGTLGETKLTDVTNLIKFRYEWDSFKYIKDHYFGELVYENNGSRVLNFKIQIPVKVHYTWGTIYTNIVAEVQKTINNANKK